MFTMLYLGGLLMVLVRTPVPHVWNNFIDNVIEWMSCHTFNNSSFLPDALQITVESMLTSEMSQRLTLTSWWIRWSEPWAHTEFQSWTMSDWSLKHHESTWTGGALQAFCSFSLGLLIKYFAASHFSSDGQTQTDTVSNCSNITIATHPFPGQRSETTQTSGGLETDWVFKLVSNWFLSAVLSRLGLSPQVPDLNSTGFL